MILFDSSAWIEYFKGSEIGKKVRDYIEGDDVITPSIVLVEILIISKKEDWNFDNHLEFIKSNSIIVGLNDEIIKYIGAFYSKQRKVKSAFSVADAIIYSTALFQKSKILTKDNDFQGLKNIEFLR